MSLERTKKECDIFLRCTTKQNDEKQIRKQKSKMQNSNKIFNTFTENQK